MEKNLRFALTRPVQPNEIQFREGDEILTLYVERTYPDGWTIGWCPERQNGMVVHPDNIVREGE